MTRVILIAVGAGLTSAVFFLAFRSGSVGLLTLTYLAPVPLLAAGLSGKTISALIAGAVASIAIMVGLGAGIAAAYLVIAAIPALIVCRFALRQRTSDVTGVAEWFSPGDVLSALTVYAVTLLSCTVIYFAGESGGIDGAARTILGNIIDQLQPAGGNRIDFPVVTYAKIFPGLLISVWTAASNYRNGWKSPFLPPSPRRFCLE
jgi:hypothetical protein